VQSVRRKREKGHEAASASTRNVTYSHENRKNVGFFKIQLADVPSAYACIRILCGCTEEVVVGVLEKFAIMLKKNITQLALS